MKNNQNPPYREKVYQALKGELGDSFTKTQEEFNSEVFSTAVKPKGVKAESQDGGFQFLSASTNVLSESDQPKPFSDISQESLSLYEEYRDIVGGTITSTQRQEIDGRIETELKTRKLPAYRDVFEAKGENFDSYENMSLDSFRETKVAKEREKELLQSFRDKNRREFLESLSDEEKTTLNQVVETNYNSLKEANKLKVVENEVKANYLKRLEEEVSQYQGKTLDQLSQEDKNNLLELSDKYTDVYNAYALNLDEINEDLEDLGTFEQERDMLLRTTSQMENLQHKAFGSVFRFLSNATNFVGELPMGGTTNIPIKTSLGRGSDEDLFPVLREIADGYDSLQKPKLDFDSIQNPSELFTWGIETTVEQTGNLLASATGNPYVTFLAVGSSAGGSKKDELRESNKAGNTNYTEEQIQTAGLFSFVVEGGTGLVTGSSLNAAKRTFKAATGSLKGGTVQLTKKALVNQALKTTGIEVVEETSAQLLDNIFHIGYLEDKERHIFDGLAESATGAIFTSGAINTVGTGAPLIISETSKAVRNNAQRKEFKGNKKRIQELVDEINSLPEGDVLREKLEPKIKELQKKNEQIIKDNIDVLEKLTPQNIKEIIKSDKKVKILLEEKKSIEESKNISEETKKELIEDTSSEILNEVKNKEYVIANSGFDTKIRKKAQEIAYNKKVKQAEEQGSKDKPIISKKDIDKEYDILLEQNREKSFDNFWESSVNSAVEINKDVADVSISVEQGLDIMREKAYYKNSTDTEKSRLERLYKEDVFDRLGAKIPTRNKTGFSKLIEDFNVKIIDKFSKVKKTFVDQAGSKGQGIADQLKLFTSKNANKLESFYKKIDYNFNELVSNEVSGQELSDFLMAKHALEANAMGRKFSEIEGSSGITDSKANLILGKIDQSGKTDLYNTLGDRFTSIIEDTRQVLRDSGLISDEQYNDLVGLYENYVPLRGFDNDNINVEEFVTNTSESNKISIKGNEVTNRKGRSTKAANVISNIIDMHTKAVLRAEKNTLLTDMAKVIEDSSGIGKVVTSKDLGITDKLRDNTVGFKVNGEQKYIVFESKSLAKTLNNADIPKMNAGLRFLRATNVYLSQMLTGRNPSFFLPNFFRDGQGSLLGLLSDLDVEESLKDVDREGLIKEIGKNTFKVMPTLFKSEIGNKSGVNEFGQYLEEFKSSGAKTNFSNVKNLDQLHKDILGLEKEFNSKSPIKKTKAGLKKSLNFLDGISSTVENSYRFSTFVSLRKRGVPLEKAAVVAKNLTVDFNQSGEWGSTINSLYLFFNAGTQSAVRASKVIGGDLFTSKETLEKEGRKRKITNAQKLLLAQGALSALVTMFNVSMSEEDEDGKTFFEKIPEYEKQTNFIIVNPINRKDYIKFPMQYGFNIIPVLGNNMVEVAAGNKTIGQAIGDWGSSVLNGFIPISVSNSEDESKQFLDIVSPAVAQPFIDLALNENFFGGSIYKDETFSKGAPDSSSGKPTTSTAYKKLAENINILTGGDEFKKGVVDVHPESIEYIVDFALGGVGKMVNNSITTAENIADPNKDTTINKIPIVRRFYGKPNEFINYTEFNDRQAKLEIMLNQKKKQYKDSEGKNKKSIAKEGKKIEHLLKGYKETKKRLKKLWKAKQEETMLNGEGTNKSKLLEEAMLKLVKKANLEYNNKLGKLK